MNSLFGDFDTHSCDLQVRKVIVVGSTGSGKSSLSHYLVGKYTLGTASKLSGSAVTKGVVQYKGSYLGSSASKVQYVVVDSEGYGADEFSTDSLKNQLINSLRFETELNCVVVCIAFERFRKGLKEDLDHLIGVIKTIGLEQTCMLLVFTHCEMYNETVKQQYLKEFKAYYSLTISDEDCLFCCFANMAEVNQNYEPLLLEDVKSSITNLREAINKKSACVNVAIKIANIEGK